MENPLTELLAFSCTILLSISTIQGQGISLDSTNICLNGTLIQNNPSFIEEIGYHFDVVKYEEDDLEDIDSLYYYLSDSVNITFEKAGNSFSLASIHLKCYTCSYNCGDNPSLAVGTPISYAIKMYPSVFRKTVKEHYPDLLKKGNIEDVPSILIPFNHYFLHEKNPIIGLITILFKNKVVDEIHIRFSTE